SDIHSPRGFRVNPPLCPREMPRKPDKSFQAIQAQRPEQGDLEHPQVVRLLRRPGDGTNLESAERLHTGHHSQLARIGSSFRRIRTTLKHTPVRAWLRPQGLRNCLTSTRTRRQESREPPGAMARAPTPVSRSRDGGSPISLVGRCAKAPSMLAALQDYSAHPRLSLETCLLLYPCPLHAQ